MSLRTLPPALVLAACHAGGQPGAIESPDAPAPDAPVDAIATWTPTPFQDTYEAHDVLRNRCAHQLRIVGTEPAEGGRHPLAIFLVGTNGQFDSPGIVGNLLPILTMHGFVAASLEYENSTLFGAGQNCNLYRDNAACMIRNDGDYVQGQRVSALARLCGRATTDCSKGVVVLGHSQGGLTALQTFHIAPAAPPPGEPVPHLVAAAPMGVGATGYLLGLAVVHFDSCMTAATLALDPSQLLVVNGENDAFFNGPHADLAGGDAALEVVTGRVCPIPSADCRGPDGAGFVLARASQTSTGTADHGYMDLPGGVGCDEPNWLSPTNTDAWGLYSVTRWLASRTTR